VYSQSWSAWPRADQGRFVIFMAGEVAVDIVRKVCLGRIEEKALRRLVEKASVSAKTAIRAAKLLVVKYDAVVVLGR